MSYPPVISVTVQRFTVQRFRVLSKFTTSAFRVAFDVRTLPKLKPGNPYALKPLNPER